MSAKLPLTVWADPGFARAFAGESGVSRGLEYEENGRVLSAWWDPRESGTVIPVKTVAWDGGSPMTEEERERARQGLWAIAREIGAHAILDESPDLPCLVAAAWDRPAGFLVNVHDGGRIDYLEIGRTLILGYQRPTLFQAAVVPPPDPRWTFPARKPIEAAAWKTVLDRLASATKDDMWIGGNKPWRITIERQRGAAS